ncbi:uncharacterized protein BDV14DRAFT_166587 [Aspergillus stella-maris]|uniref:uncharacterized protein n=1 Tax=Aspergillus stella-maris TaxID=1810926 RepID=UPI003CCDD1A2
MSETSVTIAGETSAIMESGHADFSRLGFDDLEDSMDSAQITENDVIKSDNQRFLTEDREAGSLGEEKRFREEERLDREARLRPIWATLDLTEFWRRSGQLARPGNQIHHFNWQGVPIREPSNTDPEVSPFVMGNQKVFPPTISDIDWRDIVLRNAMDHVDPVFVRLRDRVPIPEECHELMAYAEGQTFQCYSEHGRWINDTETAQSIIRDTGDVELYLDQDSVFGNGCFPETDIKTYRQWSQSVQAPQTAERPTREGPSRLRYCVNANEP